MPLLELMVQEVPVETLIIITKILTTEQVVPMLLPEPATLVTIEVRVLATAPLRDLDQEGQQIMIRM